MIFPACHYFEFVQSRIIWAMRSDYAGLARKRTRRQADCHCLINNGKKNSNVFINSCNRKVQVLTECDLRIRVASISRQNIRLDSFVTKKISVLS